jgi:hypothetical protein
MSNAAAAYYTYLAIVDKDRAASLRRFGYHASADFVAARAKRYEREARAHAKGGAPYDDAPPPASPCFPETSDSHRPSNGDTQTNCSDPESPVYTLAVSPRSSEICCPR